MRVLVVDDEPLLAAAVAKGLRRHGMVVDVAHDGVEATARAQIVDYDVMILDRDLPLLHGDDVCTHIASTRPDVRILMLTAASQLSDKVTGLRAGADDYVVKPFDFEELVERVHALGRRRLPRRPDVLERGSLRVDVSTLEATRDGRDLCLARKELGVLVELLRAEGAVVTTERLLDRVWDENIDPFTSVVRVTMSSLRRKLGPPPLITTVQGSGYRI
ncbi:response regulator transcription factor [Alloalcanivorax gelatiniphagus]